MSAPIVTLYISGRNLYVVLWNPVTGQFWNKDTAAWENYNQANWTHYAIPLLEYVSSGIYSVAYPAGIAAGVLSTEFVYQQNGATPVLPALPGGDSFLALMQSQGVNLQNIAGDGASVLNLQAAAGVEVRGAAVAGTLSTTQMSTTLTQANSAFIGRVLIFTSGAAIYQATVITGFAHTNGVLTFGAVTVAPSAADTFIIV